MHDQIKRTANGSIDTAFYVQHCHTLRSNAALARLDQSRKHLSRSVARIAPIAVILGLVVLLPVFGGR